MVSSKADNQKGVRAVRRFNKARATFFDDSVALLKIVCHHAQTGNTIHIFRRFFLNSVHNVINVIRPSKC